ncbi:MAG: hypothetical protein ACKVX9_02645 [Blastocatellia bacterium]
MAGIVARCIVAIICALPSPGQGAVGFPQDRKTAIDESRSRLIRDGVVLLDAAKDGYLSLDRMIPSPAGGCFVVVACGYECNDNVGFLFRADGSGKRKFTARWDYILQAKVEWSANGRKLFYYRVNSTGAASPANAPPEGWIELDLRTFRKSPGIDRELIAGADYAVFELSGEESLNVREKPTPRARIVGAVPAGGKGIRVTGPSVRLGRSRWVPVLYQDCAGWVNQRYLYREHP